MAWSVARLLPLLLGCAVLGALSGHARASWGFAAGVQGMVLGAALGYCSGLWGRRDDPRYWSFRQRIWISLDMVLVFAVFHYGGFGFERVGDLLAGRAREAFSSISGVRYFHRVVSGTLSGGWWAGMNAVDLGLMAFLTLAGQAFSLPPGEREDKGERCAAQAFPVLLSAAVLLPLGWGFAARGVERRATTRAAAGVVGTWELEGWDKLVGPKKRFFLLEPRDGVHDLGGASEAEPRWGLLLKREGGGFEGTLELPSGESRPATLRSRADGALELSAGAEAAVARRR